MIGNVAAAVARFASSRGATAAALIGSAGRRIDSWRKWILATGRGLPKGNGASRPAASRAPESGKFARLEGTVRQVSGCGATDRRGLALGALRLRERSRAGRRARMFSCALVTASNHGLQVG